MAKNRVDLFRWINPRAQREYNRNPSGIPASLYHTIFLNPLKAALSSLQLFQTVPRCADTIPNRPPIQIVPRGKRHLPPGIWEEDPWSRRSMRPCSKCIYQLHQTGGLSRE
ncbi:MAG: hypothetical protein ACFFD2_03255 [Promethearchaeota archaeon]